MLLSRDASSVNETKYEEPKIPGTRHLPHVSEWISLRGVDDLTAGPLLIFSTCLHELQTLQLASVFVSI